MSILRRKERDYIPTLRSSLSEMFNIDRFFEEPLFGSLPWNGNGFTRVPATNIRETDDEYVVEVAAPGMSKNDFHVDVDNNVLEIKVEREKEAGEGKAQYTRKEYDYTAFYRSFSLPDSVQSDRIKAEYENGLLLIHLPKAPEAKRKAAREIAIS
jgi:HSP20 family protein